MTIMPNGWTQEDVNREPIQAILEHAYGNCPCSTRDECMCAIAAIGEAALPKEECSNPSACSLAGNEGHQDCTPDPELITLIRNEAADAAAERIENERNVQR
jgi:hypothetical protein